MTIPKYVTELSDHGLGTDTITTLQSNGISTMEDLALAMREHRLPAVLEKGEQIAIIKSVWASIGRPLKLPERR